jgi:anthranilate phosphoribosyltransferase
VKVSTLDPRVLGLTRATLGDLQARDVEDSARIVRGVIGGEKGPHREIVVLNAAAALLVAGAAGSLREGLEMAAAAIDSGAAWKTLEVLARVSRG